MAVDLFLNTQVIYREEEMENLGIKKNLKCEIMIFLPDVQSVMPAEKESRCIIFLRGTSLEITLPFKEFVKLWTDAKQYHIDLLTSCDNNKIL